MISVVQRVSHAQVTVDSAQVGAIERGLLVLLGVAKGDTTVDAEWIARKLVALRIFPDDMGKMNLDVRQVTGSILLVSQFTLLADLSRGNRPGFEGAELPENAQALYQEVSRALALAGVPVAHGRFGQSMQVTLCNDGPVTILVDSRKGRE